jgi:CHAT domain-containing protein
MTADRLGAALGAAAKWKTTSAPESPTMNRTATTLGAVLALLLGSLPALGDELTPREKRDLEEKVKALDDEVARRFQRADYPGTTELLRETLAARHRLFPPDKYPDGHADLAANLKNMGRLLLLQGDYAGAEPYLRDALAMRQRLHPKEKFPDGHVELVQSLGLLGELLRLQGNLAQAEPCYRDALAMSEKLYPRERFPDGHPQLSSALGNLGVLVQAEGDYARAEFYLRAALQMDKKLYPQEKYPNGHLDLAASLYNLGRALQTLGEYAQAERSLREALDMYRRLYPTSQCPDGHPRIAITLNNVAFLLRAQKQYARAEGVARAALAMHRKLYPPEKFPNGHPDLAICLTSVADLCVKLSKFAEAESLYRDALAMFGKLYPPERYPNGQINVAITINNLAHLKEQSGDAVAAERLYRDALEMQRKLYPRDRYPDGHPHLAAALNNVGFLRFQQGDHARAEALFRDALGMHMTLLARYAAVAAEVETGDLLRALPLTRAAFLSAGRHLPPSASAYDLLWPVKSLSMQVMERRHRDLAASRDEQARQLGRQLVETRQRLAQALLSPTTDARGNQQRVARLTQDKEDLEKRLARQLSLAPPHPVTAEESPRRLCEVLPAGAVFIDLIRYTDFAWDDKGNGRTEEKYTARYTAFVLRKDTPPVCVELGEAAAIDEAWAAWREAITAPRPDVRAERKAAASFARLAWQPVREALPAEVTTAYLVPDRTLCQVPWGALPGRKPDTVLLDECAVCLVPHGPFLLERLAEPAAPPRREGVLVAYGGIDYAEAAAGMTSNGRTPLLGQKRAAWPELPGTAREQEQVTHLAKQLLGGTSVVRGGKAATAAQLLEDLPKARYAHLATHGFFADPEFQSAMQVDPRLFEFGGLHDRRGGARSPLVLSGLVFAGANRSGKDAAPDRGIITAEGLVGLPLEGMELAVLSACETGLGDWGGGEGVYGLQRAFHVAGCRNVLASLWKVDDGATQALMALFYHNLWEKKLDTAEALRQAQLTLYRHPDAVEVAQKRGMDFTESDLPKVEAKPAQMPKHSPTAWWAAFTFSGVRPAGEH